LEISDEILHERVLGRRVDPVTGHIYHVTYNPPKDEEVQQRLIHRADDTLEVLNTRMVDYRLHLEPIKNGFRSWYIVDSGKSKEEVFAKIQQYIETSEV